MEAAWHYCDAIGAIDIKKGRQSKQRQRNGTKRDLKKHKQKADFPIRAQRAREEKGRETNKEHNNDTRGRFLPLGVFVMGEQRKEAKKTGERTSGR